MVGIKRASPTYRMEFRVGSALTVHGLFAIMLSLVVSEFLLMPCGLFGDSPVQLIDYFILAEDFSVSALFELVPFGLGVGCITHDEKEVI